MRRDIIAVFVLCLLARIAPAAAQVDIFWASPAVVEIDESGGTVTLELALGGATDGPISAYIRVASGSTATSGEDFTGGETSVNWTPGFGNSAFLDVQIIDDNLEETQEVILIEIYDSFGAQISPTNNIVAININDNDGVSALPRVSLYGGLTAATQTRDKFCYDAQNQAYACGQSLVSEYPAAAAKLFRLAISPTPAAGDSVPVILESWGGITLESNVVTLNASGSVYLPFTVPGNGPTPFGGVRIVPSGNYSAPTQGDAHELKISVDAVSTWSPANCVGCFITAHISSDETDCGGGSCAATTGCGDGDLPPAKSATSDLDLLRRYRDQMLVGDQAGQAIVDLYGAMGGGVAAAFFADPTLAGDFIAARNSWLPALTDLLDGSGAMVVSAGMQADLTGFLDKIAAAATGDLVTQLASLRLAAALDGLTGQTIAAAHSGFTSGGATPVEGTKWGNLKAQYR